MTTRQRMMERATQKGADGEGAAASVIELAHVSKTFRLDSGKEIRGVNDVSLAIQPGEFVCVVGPSGHGKSTLLNLIAGFLKPSRGSVYARGKPVEGPGPDRGVVFQRDTLFTWKRVESNIAFGLKAQGVPKEERQEIVQQYLQLIGLEPFAKAWPKQLSGGMRRRVAIAAVFANKPDVLLMDEPFVGLDYLRLSQLHEVLLNLWADAGHRAVFMITHDVDEALTLADRVLVVREGGIALDLRIDLARPRTTELITSSHATELRRSILQQFTAGT